MANIKSAIKRIDVTKLETARNKSKKSAIKKFIKKFEAAIEKNDKEDATKLFNLATKKIDQAASKNTISKNSAAKKISRMAKELNKLA